MADNFAVGLYALGDRAAARKLDEDTLARLRRGPGQDHPGTHTSAGNLAIGLCALGEPAD